MSNMNLKDALDRALRTTKQYIDEETKLDNVLDLERTVSVFEKGEIVLDENNCFNFENGELFYNLYNIESEIKINLNNTISDKEYLLNISDPEECTYRKSDNGTESFSFRMYDNEISKFIGISLTYVEFEGISQSTLTVRTIGLDEEVTITVNSFEIVTLEYKSKIQSKMIENVDYEKITNKPYPIISIENGTNKAIPFTDWIRFNKYNLIDRRTTDINNTPYENSTGKNNEVGHPSNEINPAGNGIRVYNTAASGMENAKGLKFNISQELVDNVNAGFITFSCTFNAVSRPTMVRLVSPNGLYSEDLIPFTQSHSGASTTGTFDLSFNTAEDYSYTLLAGDYYILFAVDDPEGDTSSLINLSNVVVHIEPLRSEDKIKVTRDIDKFIERDNKIPYEPTGDYNPATKKYVDDQITENGFSGDYNDLENRPCYETPGINTEIRGPWHPGFINDEDRFEFPSMVNEYGQELRSEEMIRCYSGEVDLSWFEWSVVVMDIPRYGMSNGYVLIDFGEDSKLNYLNWDDYKLVDNVYTFDKYVYVSGTSELRYRYVCAMIVLQETTLTGTSKSVTYPPGVYITHATDTDGGTGRIEKVGIKPLSAELLPGDFTSLKNDAVLKSRDIMTELFDDNNDYDYYRNTTTRVPSLKTMISAIEYKTANLGPSIIMLSQAAYNDLGDNIDPNTLYIIG